MFTSLIQHHLRNLPNSIKREKKVTHIQKEKRSFVSRGHDCINKKIQRNQQKTLATNKPLKQGHRIQG